MRSRWYVVLGGLAALALVVVGVTWWPEPDEAAVDRGSPEPQAAPVVERVKPAAVAPRIRLRRDPTYFSCSEPAGKPFTPVRISVEGVTRGSTVLALPRDGYGVPGVPPVSTAGKSLFAFDAPGIHPGEAAGNVIMNAHTWPDGTAMGNHLLARLGEGDRLTLHGEPGKGVCYEVTERLEVPVANPPVERVYDTEGPPQVVIIVCSGTRLGPGNWSHRTLWFASPV